MCIRDSKYFVNDKVNSKHVVELGDIFFEADYNIEIMMRYLFGSDWFYDAKNIGAKIKSPIEFIAGMTYSFNIEYGDPKILFKLQQVLGQQLFKPPNVAGWKGGRSWIDNSTLMLRLNLANYLFQNSELQYTAKADLADQKTPGKLKALNASLNFDEHLKLIESLESNEKMELLSALTIQDTSKLDLSKLQPFLSNNSEDDKYISLLLRLMTMPEYQMC